MPVQMDLDGGSGIGLEDLPGALRQQWVLVAGQCSLVVRSRFMGSHADRIVIRQDGRDRRRAFSLAHSAVAMTVYDL